MKPQWGLELICGMLLTLKRQLNVPEIRKGLSEKAVRSGGPYPLGDTGRRDNPLYRQDLAKIGRGQLPF